MWGFPMATGTLLAAYLQDPAYAAQPHAISTLGIISHLKLVQNLLKRINIEYSMSSDFEGDDLIASFIKKFSLRKEYEFHILS